MRHFVEEATMFYEEVQEEEANEDDEVPEPSSSVKRVIKAKAKSLKEKGVVRY